VEKSTGRPEARARSTAPGTGQCRAAGALVVGRRPGV